MAQLVLSKANVSIVIAACSVMLNICEAEDSRYRQEKHLLIQKCQTEHLLKPTPELFS